MLITVKVENQWALLPIGWYTEELMTKTEFEVSVVVKYTSLAIEDDLSQTIDYQMISNEIKLLKQKTFKLIETAAEHLLKQIERHMINGLDIQYIAVEFNKKNIAQENVSTKYHSILVEKTYLRLEP
jgi:dihydroneopterin aldolase